MEESEEAALGAGAMARKNLQQRLLDAVKQCQIHFGARQELATETDLRVATLCVEWEAVLFHGMKRAKSKPPLKQLAGLGKSENNHHIRGSEFPCGHWPSCASVPRKHRDFFISLTSAPISAGGGRGFELPSTRGR
ncbi:Sorting nexin-29 [Geodia barretti]|uniref:Sorting nexin-29 n=1 Tax=Geodia barretti TaxID=519541 RepID=A0AA35QTL2_GEOBA|nr:Sorting nexin-29 [Geodia barretti]